MLADVLLLGAAHVGAEPDALVAGAALDDPLDAGERTATDEQDVRGVDLDELLVWVLAPALRRHRRGGALQDLEQRLLHAFTGDVARDRRVLGLAGDLVDLVDVDDAGLGLLHVVVGGLDQLQEDVLDVLTDVARLGERGGVGDRERHLQQPGERLREQRLAAAGGTDQEDVRLLQLDVGVAVRAGLHPLVVVVDRDREDLLRLLLTDDVVVQVLVDLTRLGELVELDLGALRQLLLDDLVAEIDALVADVDAGAGDQLLDLLLALAAERALQQVATVTELGHESPSRSIALDDVAAPAQLTPAGTPTAASSRFVITSSTIPYSFASDAPMMKSRSVSRGDLLDCPARCGGRGSRRATRACARSPWPGSRCRPPDPRRHRGAGGSAPGSAGGCSASRGCPAARITAAAEAAWPRQMVDTSGLMNCIVS